MIIEIILDETEQAQTTNSNDKSSSIISVTRSTDYFNKIMVTKKEAILSKKTHISIEKLVETTSTTSTTSPTNTKISITTKATTSLSTPILTLVFASQAQYPDITALCVCHHKQ